jgi:nucleotide-binding universal stress UspA family protein
MCADITRILVPVDFSPQSDAAVAYGARLAARLGATLELLHVVEDPFLTGAWSADIYVPDVGRMMESAVAAARPRLDALVPAAAGHGAAVTVSVVMGAPSRAIPDYAATNGFDLILMGTHGRTGLSHAVLGSVAERVLPPRRPDYAGSRCDQACMSRHAAPSTRRVTTSVTSAMAPATASSPRLQSSVVWRGDPCHIWPSW